ncbi:MAG: hypothetical protein K2N06_11720 [Oscillospiraceae bacterium]|nr:hypothetical protein [Oscillospiraceae bacterium]
MTENIYIPFFSYIEAYYDEDGDMLLVMNAYLESLKFNEDRAFNIYLVYADENYTGKPSSINIDRSGKVEKEPFADKWRTWYKEGYSG